MMSIQEESRHIALRMSGLCVVDVMKGIAQNNVLTTRGDQGAAHETSNVQLIQRAGMRWKRRCIVPGRDTRPFGRIYDDWAY